MLPHACDNLACVADETKPWYSPVGLYRGLVSSAMQASDNPKLNDNCKETKLTIICADIIVSVLNIHNCHVAMI